MSVDVVMPQMGESITEGTISKWLKEVGERVERDEPLLEISTDKVDAEVPAPEAGVLLEKRFGEGETVGVDTVIAVLGEENETVRADNAETAVTVEPATPSVAEPTSAPAENVSVLKAATEVVMPQMGESITEGTVSKWLKKVGETVERDEPLLEISTDKVDAEVPSPVAGTLLEIRANEGDTVEVDSVVALIGAEGAMVNQPAQIAETNTGAPEQTSESIEKTVTAAPAYNAPVTNGNSTVEELRRKKSSPLVRNIAQEHNIDISTINGTGLSGRVTKNDILNFIESGAAVKPEDLLTTSESRLAPEITSAAEPVALPSTQSSQSIERGEVVAPAVTTGVGDRIEPMSVMRKKIADHMIFSKQTSAHVTSVYEIDMTNVSRFRDTNKAEFQNRYGTKLTFMPFIFQAVANALRKFPVVNAQVAGDQIIYKGNINLGMAVALDWGLIVPVIKRADSLSLAGLAQTANDLADRARTKKLLPDEVAGGTFTITNPGVFGGLYGTPIINQPQVAILCVGTIEKRPKVVTTSEGDDMIAIRQMAYFALTYDHRIVDGADAEQFLSFLKNDLETSKFTL
ncbi:MAG: 2-oxoglutarate dehydrogenase, E2 component, dihydrolipoamide succinyltransferase [Pyrinomonadaceae bacterium]